MIISTDLQATWRQYIGLILLLVLVILFVKRSSVEIVFTATYLLLATFNLLSMRESLYTVGISIGPVSSPGIQPMSLLLFVTYFCFNFEKLTEMYLDWREKDSNN